MINVYEAFFLLDPNKTSADMEGVAASFHEVIERHGGEIAFTRHWGDSKLAYPIKKFRKGAYWLTYFKAESTSVPGMEKEFHLNEAILRYLVIKHHEVIGEQILTQLLSGGELPGPTLSDDERSDRDDRHRGDDRHGGGGGRRGGERRRPEPEDDED